MAEFDDLLFRASGNGKIMTAGTGEITPIQLNKIGELLEKRQTKPLTETQEAELVKLVNKRDNPTLSQTCIERILKVYAQVRWAREEEIRSRYMEKGTNVEQDNITLYSRLKKTVFFKNELELKDQWTSGTPDAGNHKQTILKATEVLDFKSSWSLITFLKAKFGDVEADYYWQGQTYLSLLPKAHTFRLIYGLVNSPLEIILQEKKNMQYKLGVTDPEAITLYPEFQEHCRQIELNHIFDMPQFMSTYPHFESHWEPEYLEKWPNIPMEQRMFETVIPRDEEAIGKLHLKIGRCREWMRENLSTEPKFGPQLKLA